MKTTFEIRQIDAIAAPEEGWIWNTSYYIGTFTTAATDEKRAFLRALHSAGIVCKRGKCKVNFDGDIYELTERGTDKPLFAAIPLN